MEKWSFEELAASFRADSQDLATFHEVLAKKLEDALPQGAVQIRRGGWAFSSNRPLVELNVDLGGNVFKFEHTNRGYQYRLSKMVRGIALKNEALKFTEWLDALAQALWEEANRSDETRQALERFLIEGR